MQPKRSDKVQYTSKSNCVKSLYIEKAVPKLYFRAKMVKISALKPLTQKRRNSAITNRNCRTTCKNEILVIFRPTDLITRISNIKATFNKN